MGDRQEKAVGIDGAFHPTFDLSAVITRQRRQSLDGIGLFGLRDLFVKDASRRNLPSRMSCD